MQFDRWGMRQVEKVLAAELHLALAEYQRAMYRAGSDLEAAPFAADTDQARSRLKLARTRWVEFVRSGKPPADLQD